MASYSKSLERWLVHTFIVQHVEGPCIRLSLKHVAKGGGDVQNYPIGTSSEITPDFLEELQSRIETDAQVDAQGLGGVQRYQLLNYHSSEPDRSVGRFTFRDGDPSNEEDDFNTEPANEKGLVAQQMRHNEALIRSQVTSVNNMLNVLVRQNEKLSHEKDALIEDRFKNMEVMERLMSAHHERALAEQQAEFKMMMQKDMVQKLSLLAPSVVNRIAGKNLLPEPVNPMMMMMKGFAESLRPDQFDHIMSGLSPEQKIVLMDFMKMTQGGNDDKNGAS